MPYPLGHGRKNEKEAVAGSSRQFEFLSLRSTFCYCLLKSVPGRIRTSDLLIRNQMLYPAELQALEQHFATYNTEEEGFEPSHALTHVYRFSKPAP